MYDLNNEISTSNNSMRMATPNSFAALLSGAILATGALLVHSMYREPANLQATVMVAMSFLALSFLVFSSVQIADQWNRAVVLRLGKFQALRGPGLFLIIPFIDNIVYWIDTRVLTTAF